MSYKSVSQLVLDLNSTLEKEHSKVFFEGELSSINRASSGHIYFIVKDQFSSISAVIWKSYATRIPFQLQEGLSVQCVGKAEIYRGSGKFQMIINNIQLGGEGILLKKFHELKLKLDQEGLFSQENKKQIPFFPKGIGIVTSAGGAVIHDITIKLQERMPNIEKYLIDVRVQGEGAAEEIASAIRKFNDINLVDVLIVARGGGSLQDLWAFNEEVVVRAIHASKIPIISGVGHEVDITLADLAADLRAPTPTAAAEFAVPKREDLISLLDKLDNRLRNFERWFHDYELTIDEIERRFLLSIKTSLEKSKMRLKLISGKVDSIHPVHVCNAMKSKIDLIEQRFNRSLELRVTSLSLATDRASKRLAAVNPVNLIQQRAKHIENLEIQLDNSLKNDLLHKTRKIEAMTQVLNSLNPQKVLKRGFSVVKLNGTILRSATNLVKHDKLDITFSEGEKRVEVID